MKIMKSFAYKSALIEEECQNLRMATEDRVVKAFISILILDFVDVYFPTCEKRLQLR